MDELPDARSLADHDVIGEDDGERLVADQVLGHQHGVPETELLLLADVGDLGQVADRPDLPEHLDVALLLEQVLELEGQVEVVLDRPLLAGGHDDDLLDTGGDGLFDRVLDDRLVDEGQHLLRLRLGGRAGSGCPSRRRGRRPCERASNLAVTGWAGRESIPRGPGYSPVTPIPADLAKSRTTWLNATGRSRFDRCRAPRRTTRRAFLALAANVGAERRNSRSYSPLRIRTGPPYAARRGTNRSPNSGPQRERATAGPESAGHDRLGDRRRVARPEEPAAEAIQAGTVEVGHDPRQSPEGQDARLRPAPRTPRRSPARGRARGTGRRASSPRSRPATGRPRPRCRPAARSRIAATTTSVARSRLNRSAERVPRVRAGPARSPGTRRRARRAGASRPFD